MVNDDFAEFFDEDDVVTDSDEFKPGFFDEEDDEFFKSLDDEKNFENEVFEDNHMPNNVIKIELNPDGSVKKVSRNFKD